MDDDLLFKGNNISSRWHAQDTRYDTLVSSEQPDINEEDILLQSDLDLEGINVKAYLTDATICWCAMYPATRTQIIRYSTHTVPTSNILTVQYEQRKKKGSLLNEIEMFPTQYFSLHFAKKIKHHKWKYQHVIFHTVDSETCQQWVESVQVLLNRYRRPKNLLVFVNPVGGKKQAQKIYREKVAPIFDLARITQNIIITERMDHAKDFLQAEDISGYDGVLSVGGDGMFSEIINGMLRYQDGVHTVVKTKSKQPLRLGIIPAGSTDTVAYCTSGTNCPVTAALHIALGDELSLDVCSVWHNDNFVKYSVSLMGYGYFGDLAKESEALRWMGPKRYEFAGFKKFMANKSYEGEISFIESDMTSILEANGRSSCKSGCQRCSLFVDETDASVSSENWKTISGRFISVIGANISCRCARSSTGLSPHAHTGDGHIDLILIKKTTRAKYLHHLIKVSGKTVDNFDFNFIDVYRVKEFKFKPIILSTNKDDNSNGENNPCCSHHVVDQSKNLKRCAETSVWNVDGEILETPDIHIRVHRQLLSVYARGIEE